MTRDDVERALAGIGLRISDISAEQLELLVNDDDHEPSPRELAASIDRVSGPGRSERVPAPRRHQRMTEAEEARLDGLSPRELADKILPPRGF